MFPQIFGKYVLEREIAAGGMARVYLATLRGAVGFEKRLVVKQIRPELASDDAFVARFVEEAKTTVELSHPNIVPVYELGVEQGIYYIALEFCEGITLADLLSLTGPLEPEQGAYVGVEICRALDYAHRRAGVVHRDVTPRNVLIDEEGAVRLIDFGIAERARAPAKPEDTEIFGSPGHMPPEQIRGDALTSATDVFAVGALLFEAWTGKAAYRRPKVADAYVAVHTRPAPLGEQVAALRDLDSVLHDALAPEPAERLQGADDLSRPLRDFLRQSDLGDLALRLGDRVRHARRKARGSVASIPDLERAGSEADVVTPAGEGTATFAANDEIQVWTRKLDKLPPEAADVEDLLVVSQRNPEPDSGATRRLEKPSESGPATRRISSPPASEPTGSGLEVTTGPGAGQNPRPAGARLSIVLALVAGLAGFGIAALFFFPKDDVAPTGAAQPTAAAGAVSSPISAQKTAVEAAPEPSAEPTHLPGPRPAPAPAARGSSSAQQGKGTTPSSGSAPAPVAETSARAPAGTATLSLTSVPPAQVSVAGRARGTTPVMGLSLPAGTHGVVFQSPALGESVPTSVRLAPGQKRSIHVDFTGASPRVIVR